MSSRKSSTKCFWVAKGKYCVSFTNKALICYAKRSKIKESWSREWAADSSKTKKLSKVWENKRKALNDYIPAGSLHPSIFHPQGEDSRLTMGVGADTRAFLGEPIRFSCASEARESGAPCVTQLSDIGQKARTKGLRDGWMGRGRGEGTRPPQPTPPNITYANWKSAWL